MANCWQLSGLNPFAVSNNKNYRLKKSGLLLLYTNNTPKSDRLKIIIEKTLKFLITNIDSESLQGFPEILSNFEPQKPWKYKQLWGWDLTQSFLQKKISAYLCMYKHFFLFLFWLLIVLIHCNKISHEAWFGNLLYINNVIRLTCVKRADIDHFISIANVLRTV